MLHGKTIAMLTGRVVKRSTFQAGVMELAVRSVLINIITVGFVSTDGLEFAQRRVVIIT